MIRLIRALVVLLPAVAVESGRRPPATARPDILRVQANDCAGDRKDRVGTGFAWHSPREVVTALQVVAGCQRLSVYSERDQLTYRANIVHVLRRADLALVAVDGNAAFPPIVEVAGQAQVNLDLTAWGYAEGIPAMRDFRPLRIANGAPGAERNVCRRRGDSPQ